MSFVCYECADRHRAAMYPVGDRYLCEPCAEKVRDVLELAAALQISVYDLAAAVVK